jgi:hypothetical protein
VNSLGRRSEIFKIELALEDNEDAIIQYMGKSMPMRTKSKIRNNIILFVFFMLSFDAYEWHIHNGFA